MTGQILHESRLILLLAWRNLWRNRRRTSITLTSISVGFAIAVLFIGIGDGAHNSMIRNAIKLGDGHLVIQPKGYQNSPANDLFLPNAEAVLHRLSPLSLPGTAEPRVVQQVLISSAHHSVGATLEGFPVLNSTRTEMVRPHLTAGRWLEEGNEREVVIGEALARKLRVRVGQKLVIMAGTKGGNSQSHLVRVQGVFRTSVEELDTHVVLADLALGQRFLAYENVEMPATKIALYLTTPESMTHWQVKVQQALQQTVPGRSGDADAFEVLNWQQVQPQLVQFIALDDAGNYVFLGFILLMVVFGIANTLLMSVLERTREFGLLQALGVGPQHLMVLVFCESVMLACVALVLGWALGGGLHLWFSYAGLDLSAIMGENTALAGTVIDSVVHTELSGERILALTLILFVATTFTGLYPAWKAVQVPPVAALRT